MIESAEELRLEDEPAHISDSTLVEQLLTDSQSQEDRRADPYRSVRSQSKSPIHRWLNDAVEQVEQGPMGLIVLVLCLLAACACFGWVLLGHMDELAERQAKLRTLEGLTQEVTLLERQRTDWKLNEVLADLDEADSRVFRDYSALSAWLSEQYAAADQLQLNLAYSIGDAEAMSARQTAEVPISVVIRPESEELAGTYFQALQLLKNLVDSRWFVEVTGLQMTGDQSSIMEVATEIRVWVHSGTVTNEFAE